MANDQNWKKKLTPEQYHIMREKGTEAPFTGRLLHNNATGDYTCMACGQVIFDSHTKFDSGSGWPSFYDVTDSKTVKLIEDSSGGISRTEVQCARCGSHLGHVFHDVPDQPTGMRYCINSAPLDFKPHE